MSTGLSPAPAVPRHELLTREQAAEYLGVKSQTLAVWHSSRRYNIPVVKVGRSVRYRLADLNAFIEGRVVGGSDTEAAK